jgi:hypothetical protein
MGWKISVGAAGFGRSMNAGVITFSQCRITSTSCHTVAQLRLSPNTGKTTLDHAGSNPACQAQQVWQNVLSTLVGV